LERAELKAWLRLTLAPGIGNGTARKLLAAFGSAEAIFTQSDAALRQLGTEKLVRSIALKHCPRCCKPRWIGWWLAKIAGSPLWATPATRPTCSTSKTRL
jgi:hypothetical protein